MSKGIIETVGGSLLIAAGALASATGVGAGAAQFLISAGAGLVISGIGTMIAQAKNIKGFATTERNPIAPWEVQVGETRVGGTLVYIAEFGENNRFLDLIIVTAAHLSWSVDEIRFDNQRLQIGKNNTSFTPLQQTINIALTADITRATNPLTGVSDVVTVFLSHSNIPLLADGDYLLIQGVEPSNLLMNGKFQITVISQDPIANTCSFYYLAGGPPTSGSGSVPVTASGNVSTQWQNYGANVYVETINDGPENLATGQAPYNLVGATTVGTTFSGETNGTPLQGSFSNGNIQNAANAPNPWTPFCSLVGFTAVMLRLQYDPNFFPGGIPQISFIQRGKCDIYDPRLGAFGDLGTTTYTENSALIIADYLYNSIWGFSQAYGTQINTTQLIAAANACDVATPIPIPFTSPYTTEPAFTCNGRFTLASRRGEILENLLTSCAGRVTYVSGQWYIWPGVWAGSSLSVSNAWVEGNAAGPIRWRPSVTINNRYNGVKGTYISPVNNWQASDFPRYAQDVYHGYNDGLPPNYDVNLDYDEGQRLWKDIQLPFTTSCDTAQRLAKIELLRSLYMGTGTFFLNMAGYQIAPLDVIQMTFNYFGWTGKYLEVSALRLKVEKQNNIAVILGVEIDVQETDPSVYTFFLIEDLSPQGNPIPGIPNAVYTPDPPSNLQISGGLLTWNPPLDAYVSTIEGRYMQVTSPPGLWIQLASVPDSVTQLELPGLVDGETYLVQLRSVNGAGVASAWVSITTVGGPEFQWAPYQIQAAPTDALWPNEWTFDLTQTYMPTSGVDWTAIATVTGVQPVNTFLPNSVAPTLTALNLKPISSGGTIPGGALVYVGVGAIDASGNSIPPSSIISIVIPTGTNSNSIIIADAPAQEQGNFIGNPTDGNVTSIAGKNYTFQSVLTNVDGNVLIGADVATTAANLTAAVNLGPGAGSVYAAATTANPGCIITAQAGPTVICQALIAGPFGNTLTCSGILDWLNGGNFSEGAYFTWPAVSGLAQYVIFAAIDNQDLICAQGLGPLTPMGSPPTGYTPTSITLTDISPRSTWAYPNAATQVVRVKGTLLIHGGVEGAAVDAVSLNTIVARECIDSASPPIDNWTGRAVAIIGRDNGSAPYVSFNCTAFNPTTGAFTFSEDPVAAGVQVGDALVVCTLGVDNSANPMVITDPGLSNAQDLPTPHAGLIPNDPTLLGTTVLVIAGTSRGQTAHIVSNGPTSLNLDAPLPIDASSVWIIMGSSWPYQNDSVTVNNSIFSAVGSIPLTISNAVGGSVLIACFTVDNSGNESFLADAPIRMLFAYGAGMAEINVTADYQMLATDQVVYADATAGPFTVTLPSSSVVRTSPRVIIKTDTSSNIVTIEGFDGVETVGSLGNTTLSLKVQGDSYTLLPNNT